MRIFIGIAIPESVKEYIESIKPNLDNLLLKGRWTRIDNLHVTLAFLGEVPPDQIDLLSHILENTLIHQARFTLGLSDIGFFDKGNQSIVWLGIDQGKEHLRHLSKIIKYELNQHRFPYDNKPMIPHLTFVRQASIKKEVSVPKIRQDILWKVEHIHLYLSHQKEGLLTYEPLYTIPLK